MENNTGENQKIGRENTARENNNKKLFTIMKTTYYRMLAIDEVWRATTDRAQEKIKRLAERMPDRIKPLPPKEARELIAAKKEYWKIRDIM